MFVQNTGKFLLALKHIPEDYSSSTCFCLLGYEHSRVNQSLDLNTVRLMMESQWVVQRLVLCNTRTQNIALYYQV